MNETAVQSTFLSTRYFWKWSRVRDWGYII